MTFYQQDTYIFRCYKIYIYILRESKREFRYRNLPVIRKLACSAFFFVTRTIVNPNDVSAHTAPCCTGVCLWSIRPSIHPSIRFQYPCLRFWVAGLCWSLSQLRGDRGGVQPGWVASLICIWVLSFHATFCVNVKFIHMNWPI